MDNKKQDMDILVENLENRYGNMVRNVYDFAQENVSRLGFEQSSSLLHLRLAYEALNAGDSRTACEFLGIIYKICEVKPSYNVLAQNSESQFIRETAQEINLEKNDQLKGAVKNLIKELSGQS